MSNDTLTIALNGEVSLRDFAVVIEGFQELAAAISPAGVEWVVAELQVGSATTTVRGTGPGTEEAVFAYERIGKRLQAGETIPSPAARAAADKILSVINGQVTSVRMETADAEFNVYGKEDALTAKAEPRAEYGSVEGRIQTLSSRGGLRFTLFDLVHDRAVSCYQSPDSQELLREAWGRFAAVEGLVCRDPITGHPTSVRRITSIRLLPEGDKYDYLRAGGSWRSLPSGRSSEILIRNLRDAQ